MTSYIDYKYYVDTYEGTLIPEDQFNKAAAIASAKVRQRILNRDIKGYEDQVKMATCMVADVIYNQLLIKERIIKSSTGEDVIVTSEKVGDYSRNLGNGTIQDIREIASNETVGSEIEDILENCLWHTGLLYAGIYHV